MKFSMMTYTLMRQKGFTPFDCIRIASELKMSGIDWVTTYGQSPAELRKRCDDAGLPVAAHTFFLRRFMAGENDWQSEAMRSLDDAVGLEAPVVMIPPIPLPGITTAVENRKRWIAALAEVAPPAAERNLVLTVENFPGVLSPFVTASDFHAAQREVPALKLTFDNGNAATGEDQLASLHACAKDIAHVHFKDWRRSAVPAADFRPMRDGCHYSPALIGEGVIDSRATLRELEAIGYQGFINIEYEGDRHRADRAVKQALDYLKS